MLFDAIAAALAIYLVQTIAYTKLAFIKWGGVLAGHWTCTLCFAFWPGAVLGWWIHGISLEAVAFTLVTMGAAMALDVFVTAAEGN